MAPDKVYPDVEAPVEAPQTEATPPGAYYNVNLDQQIPPPATYQEPPPGTKYNVKDQQIPPPATYQERRRGRSTCCSCLIWFCVIQFILLVLLGLFVLIFWLIVMPKTPQFDLKTVNITGLTGTSSDTTIDYQLMAYNPNKEMDFYYSDISFQVQASGNVIGKDSIPDFSQGHKNTTYINGETTDNAVVLSSDALTSITKNESNVALYAEVDLKVKVKVWGTKSRNMKSKAKCNINVDLTVTSGSQLKNSDCKFHWYLTVTSGSQLKNSDCKFHW